MIESLLDINEAGIDVAVQAYMTLGIPIFPCKPGDKAPASRHGFKDAIRYLQESAERQSALMAQVPAFFAQDKYNVGIATGDVVDVLDVDVKGGRPGLRALRTIRDAGLLDRAVAIARTPSGGWHVYYPALGQRSRSVPSLGLDFKAEGGYVVAPPSSVLTFHDGSITFPKYEWVETRSLDEGGTLSWDEVKAALKMPEIEQVRTWDPVYLGVTVAEVVDGMAEWVKRQSVNRNNALFWAVNRCVEAGARSEEELEPLVQASLSVVLPEDGNTNREGELWATVRSALKNSGV